MGEPGAAVTHAKRRAEESRFLAMNHRDASRRWMEKSYVEPDPTAKRVWLALATQQSDLAQVHEDAAETFAEIAGEPDAD